MDITVQLSMSLDHPTQIELLGPIQNRWEGGLGGEGFLCRVKPLLRPGRKNWQKNTFHRILRDKSCKQLLPNDGTEDNSDEVSKSQPTNLSGNFKIYHTHSYLCDDLEEGKVILCFGFWDKDDNDGITSCYLHSGIKKVVRSRLKTEHNIVHFGANYFPIETQDCNHSEDLGVLSEILFLVFSYRKPVRTVIHFILSSHWNGVALTKME